MNAYVPLALAALLVAVGPTIVPLPTLPPVLFPPTTTPSPLPTATFATPQPATPNPPSTPT